MNMSRRTSFDSYDIFGCWPELGAPYRNGGDAPIEGIFRHYLIPLRCYISLPKMLHALRADDCCRRSHDQRANRDYGHSMSQSYILLQCDGDVVTSFASDSRLCVVWVTRLRRESMDTGATVSL